MPMIEIPAQLLPYATFPLHTILPGLKCACIDPTCTRAGKHPAIAWSSVKSGEHRPDTKPGQGRGIVCGRGLCLVDLDPKEGLSGVQLFQSIATAHGGIIPRTYAVRTPRGGLHLFYSVPEGFEVATNQGVLGAGIDLRGEGGYAVMAGSPHKSGGLYMVACDEPIAPCPDWLLPLVKRSAHEAPQLSAHLNAIDTNSEEGNRRMHLFHQACLTYPPSVSEQGGHAAIWNLVIFGARTLALPPQAVYELAWAFFNPRCSPPWSENELAHKVKSAILQGRTPFDSQPPANWDGDLEKLIAIARAPKIVQALPRDASEIPPRRALAGPQHIYSFRPETHVLVGDEAAPDKPRAISMADTIRVLVTSVAWGGSLQYDVFNDRVLAVRPPCPLDAEKGEFSENDVTRIRAWFERTGCKISQDQVRLAVLAAAAVYPVDPLYDYIAGLPTSGVTRAQAEASVRELAQVLIPCVSPLADTLFMRFLVGACKRALNPGAKHDAMLVLVGDQGIGKSTAIEALFGTDWYRSQMPELASRDASHALHGKFGIEMGELDRVLRAEASVVKEYISRTVDEYRAFGTGQRVQKPRRAVFVGTTNQMDFLRDDDEFRRFWPVQIGGRISVPEIAARRDEFWTAGKVLLEHGVPNYLDSHELRNILRGIHTEHEEIDPWTDQILAAVAEMPHVNAGDAYLAAFGKYDMSAAQKLDRRITGRVGLILRRAGWRASAVRGGEKIKKVFMKPC